LLATVRQIADYLEELAPPEIALPGDPVGLQVGDPRREVRKVLVALDLDEAVLKQALDVEADMVVTHHPLLYTSLSCIDESRPSGSLIAAIIRNKITVYSAHTNLDIAPQGVNRLLADRLGLEEEGRVFIQPSQEDRLLKLVVFVPRDHEDAVADAVAEAGAGWIGRYSHCTFRAPGTGTFMPREGTSPYIGETGRLEKVEEVRLETVLPVSRRRAVLKALLEAHPYEEVAYDLYPLALSPETSGLGLVGTFSPPLGLEQILERCRRELKPEGLRFWVPDKERRYSRVAVCGGSGGSLVEAAFQRGAQLYIAGDFRYHDLKKAQSLGLGLIDAGHAATERLVVGCVEEYLRGRLARDGFSTGVVAETRAVGSGWDYLEG